MKNNTALIVIGVLIVAVLGFVLVKSPKMDKSKPTNSNESLSTTTPSLSFSPSSLKLASGASTTVAVTLDPNQHTSVAATLSIKYDPAKVSIVQIKTGTMFANVLSPVKISGGVAEISVGTPPTSKGQTQSGTVVNLTIKSLSNSSSVISFGEDTMVASLDLQGNILKTMGTLKIN